MSQNGLMPKFSNTITNLLISLGLFLLALLPRAYDLSRFVTADEAKWVYRSAQFLAAFLQGEWAATTVNLTPAVTTTWLGSLGLAIYYQLNQAAIGLPFVEWLQSLPEFRTDLDILVATRWPMVILGSLFVVGLFWAVRSLVGPAVAFTAALFVTFDPHTVALSRILGHDAVVTIFMSLSLVLLLLAVRGGPESSGPRTWLPLTLSGIAAGLAFLSKAPALFLIPFAGLICLSKIWLDRRHLWGWLGRFGLWAVAAYLTFSLVWPAAWVDPLGRPLAVFENAFLSATDVDEADDENYWLVPDLGPFYYLVHGGFKLSPLVAAGLVLVIITRVQQTRRPTSQSPNLYISPSPPPTLWFIAFIILFTLFMTLSTKRSPRYILPIFPILAILAALGWFGLYRMAANNLNVPSLKPYGFRLLFYSVLTLSALVILLPYVPYYFTYFNPLLGGSLTAPTWVKLGWGEGLDHVGRFLQRVDPGSRVGTAYSSTVAPYFQGDLSGLDGDRLDYVVLYAKQVQSGGSPLLPEVITYYRQTEPIYTVKLNGIRYADVYPGPAVQLSPNVALGSQTDGPLGYRLGEPYGRIGQPL
ncbi:MAG: glycosyltransferase family 39 protein, partial [Anaerolineae bacterium]|nr:glycosyltransferase family 39 protein [Anaerolineae bacterium]